MVVTFTGLSGAMCWKSCIAIGTNFLSPVTKNKPSGTHNYNTYTTTTINNYNTHIQLQHTYNYNNKQLQQ